MRVKKNKLVMNREEKRYMNRENLDSSVKIKYDCIFWADGNAHDRRISIRHFKRLLRGAE